VRTAFGLIVCLAVTAADPEPPPKRPKLPEGQKAVTGTVTYVLRAPRGKTKATPPMLELQWREGDKTYFCQVYFPDRPEKAKPTTRAEREYLRYYKDGLNDVRKGDEVEVAYAIGRLPGVDSEDWGLARGARVIKKAKEKDED
jgi:hypothetical protein